MKNKSKKLVVVLVILILLAMAVAYAAVSQTLTITGTARVAADVSQVVITGNSLTASSSNEVINNPVENPYTSTTATFDVTLPQPGAEATYTVTIENKGNSTASLSSTRYFNAASTAGEPAESLAAINAIGPEGLKFEVSEIPATLTAGQIATVTVKAYWDTNFPNIGTDESKTMTLEIVYGLPQS